MPLPRSRKQEEKEKESGHDMLSAKEARSYVEEDQQLADEQARKIASKMLSHIAEPAIRRAMEKHCRRAHAEELYDETMAMLFNASNVNRISKNGILDIHTQIVEEMSIKYASEMLRDAGYRGGFWVGVKGESLYNGGRGTFKALMFEGKF